MPTKTKDILSSNSKILEREMFCPSLDHDYISGPMAKLWGHMIHCLLISCSGHRLSEKTENADSLRR